MQDRGKAHVFIVINAVKFGVFSCKSQAVAAGGFA